MKIIFLFVILFISHVDLRRHNQENDDENAMDFKLSELLDDERDKHRSDVEQVPDYVDESEKPEKFEREKKYPARKKILDDPDYEQPAPPPASHRHHKNNHSLVVSTNRPTTTARDYLAEASLCINEYDVKPEQLVKVKELQNGARMIRFVIIGEASSTHGLSNKDVCMLHCCVEKECDLAMLSEQRSSEGYKCYLFACNDNCTFATHRDYVTMAFKKEQDKTLKKDKSPDATSSTLASACRSTEFSCRDGSCIPYYDVCNSYDDCPSGVDEAICSTDFLNHQRTQQQNRKKPAIPEIDSNTNAELDEAVDEMLAEEEAATTTTTTATTTIRLKTKNKNKEGFQSIKNLTSSFHDVDFDTEQRISKLQKLKEHLEDTKGPEAWYHLFQSLVQQQHQDHANYEPEQISSSANDEDTMKDQLLAFEQQWIAERQLQKSTSSTTTTTMMTTIKPKIVSRKTTTLMVVIDDDVQQEIPRTRLRRPPPSSLVDDELTEDENEYLTNDGDHFYWQPDTSSDDRRNRHKIEQTIRRPPTTRRPRIKSSRSSLPIRYNTSEATLLRAYGDRLDYSSHSVAFLRESSVVLVLLLGLLFTMVLLVLVGFYCRDSWKRGRTLKNRATDADYLINGLYL